MRTHNAGGVYLLFSALPEDVRDVCSVLRPEVRDVASFIAGKKERALWHPLAHTDGGQSHDLSGQLFIFLLYSNLHHIMSSKLHQRAMFSVSDKPEYSFSFWVGCKKAPYMYLLPVVNTVEVATCGDLPNVRWLRT